MKDEPATSSPAVNPASQGESRANPDTEQLAAQMSALLADLVRTPDTSLEDWVPSLRVGDRLGRFTLVRELGRGGMGVVWEAEDPDLARRVAVKVVRPGSQAGRRGPEWMRREAEAVARLSHPNIVTLFDFGLAESGPFLVFELLRGEPLDRRLRHGPLPFDSVLAIAAEACRALVHAHKAGVIHRDLKPANVFVADDGEVKVLDFGLAALLGRTGPRQGGTPAFMAPEQWRGELGEDRTDLFALGVTLWSALTGGVPFAVKAGRSAVEDPGPAPRLPPQVAPARFRRLVERCLARDPAERPASAAKVLEELRALQRDLAGRGWRRTIAVLSGAALAASLVAGWLWWDRGPPAGERLPVVVADAENTSGEPALDRIGPVLATSLEQSRRLQLVPRARLAALAREAKVELGERLDGRTARALARLAGARALLLPSARRDGAGLLLELRALDVAEDRALFTLSESAHGLAEVPPVLDRLAEAARRRLRERSDDLATGRIRVGEAFTANLEALRAYQDGVDCMSRPAEQAGSILRDCPAHFERALALDPAFALAHYRLGLLATPWGAPPERGRPHLAAALRAVDRLPAREAALVQAWAAHLDGQDEAALGRYDELLARYPDDVEALEQAAWTQAYRGRHAEAVPYWQRLLAVDPAADEVRVNLLEALARLGRGAELAQLVAEARAQPQTPVRVSLVVRGLLHLGQGDEAVAVASAAFQGAPGPMHRRSLAAALDSTGRFEALEALLRREVGPDPNSSYLLADAVAAQGRLAEALRIFDEAARRDERAPAGLAPYVRAMWLPPGSDGAAFWREAARVGALSASYAEDLAVVLALRGDLPHAAELARALTPGDHVHGQYEALLAWRRGDPAAAMARLGALEGADPEPVDGLYPVYLLAEVASAAGDHREALGALERWWRLPAKGYWHGWAFGRSLLLAARARAALGDPAAARRDLDRLLGLLRRADPDHPVSREARALQARLQARAGAVTTGHGATQ